VFTMVDQLDEPVGFSGSPLFLLSICYLHYIHIKHDNDDVVNEHRKIVLQSAIMTQKYKLNMKYTFCHKIRYVLFHIYILHNEVNKGQLILTSS